MEGEAHAPNLVSGARSQLCYWNLTSSTVKSTVHDEVAASLVPTVPDGTVTCHWRPTTCLAFAADHLLKSARVNVIVVGVLEGVPIFVLTGYP